MPLYALSEKQPTVPDDGFIAPGTHIVGDVQLGARVGVWFGAVIRGDNEPIIIGEDTNIQDGAILHSDPGSPLVIGAKVTIGHRAIVHGCRIGDGTLIGMGATILNNAVIGRNCLVGAGALVTEGKSFPDGSLIVGSPAKIVRELDASAIEALGLSATNYVSNASRFAKDLQQLD
jgi:carbonic anhydrase/acetyltransferase-like protein (isoleucine patch superfamily)